MTPGSSATGFYVTSFLQGNASRYYRSNQLGTYVQDKWQITPTLSLTAGVRYDWDGGLTEKYGRIFNFDPSTNPQSCTPSTSDPNAYSYCPGSDTITNPGLIIAGNNANGTKGVSNTTLTGRQWGIAPRVGAAWQPASFHNKVVVRAGGGMYYDRGELFSYFSPGYAIGTVTGGPFGVNQQLPFVNASTCPATSQSLYEDYIPTCGGNGGFNPPNGPPTAETGNLENPYGTTLEYSAPNNPKASDLSNYLPNACSIANYGFGGIRSARQLEQSERIVINNGQPISLGVYDRANKLPYTINYTLDIQWQPRTDWPSKSATSATGPPPGHSGSIQPADHRLALQPRACRQPLTSRTTATATPWKARTVATEQAIYGPLTLPDGTCYLANYEGGNVDLRVPYIGYAAESIDYEAAGVDAYNALQAHIEKRMSHGVQVGVSYT